MAQPWVGGLPYLPLRHENSSLDIDDRVVMHACELTEREQGMPHKGKWRYRSRGRGPLSDQGEIETFGDLTCAMRWQPADFPRTLIRVPSGAAAGGFAGGAAGSGNPPGAGRFGAGGNPNTVLVPLPPQVDPRVMPGWSFGWPALVDETPGTESPRQRQRRRSIPRGQPNREIAGTDEMVIKPIFDRGWSSDQRYADLTPAQPTFAPDLPKQWGMVVHAGSWEDQLHELAFPGFYGVNTDHETEGGDLASRFFSVQKSGDIDPFRWARTNTAFRIALPRRGGLKRFSASGHDGVVGLNMRFSAADDRATGYGLSYGMGESGKGPGFDELVTRSSVGTLVGLFGTGIFASGTGLPQIRTGGSPQARTSASPPDDEPRDTRELMACLSHEAGGPIHFGAELDQHRITVDVETDEPINAAHLDTQTLWYGHSGDGPMAFSSERWNDPSTGPFLHEVRLVYDPDELHQWGGSFVGRGKWKWQGYAYLYPEGKEEVPPGGPTPALLGESGIVSPRLPGPWKGEPDRYTATTMEMLLPSITFRPQDWSGSSPLLIYDDKISQEDLDWHRANSPIVGRLVAFGKQPNDGSWSRTERPDDSRAPAGTGPGLLMLTPPEVDGGDLDTDFEPLHRTISEFGLVAGPNTFLAVGLPRLAGGLSRGLRLQEDLANPGDIVWYSEAAGVQTELTRYDLSNTRFQESADRLWLDDKKSVYGSDADSELYWDSANSRLTAVTAGEALLQGGHATPGSGAYVKATAAGMVDLNGVSGKGLSFRVAGTEEANLDATNLTLSGIDLVLNDDKKLKLGTSGAEGSVYSDGTDAIVEALSGKKLKLKIDGTTHAQYDATSGSQIHDEGGNKVFQALDSKPSFSCQGTTIPGGEDHAASSFVLWIDTDGGTNGQLKVTWNDASTYRTATIGEF